MPQPDHVELVLVRPHATSTVRLRQCGQCQPRTEDRTIQRGGSVPSGSELARSADCDIANRCQSMHGLSPSFRPSGKSVVSKKSEQQAKFVQERIITVEKHFAEMCAIFGSLARKSAGLRDKNDDLSKAIKNYADTENVNQTLKVALTEFSSVLLTVGDYCDVKVNRLESKVTNELSQYDSICKHSREEVKATFSAREKEVVRKRQLDRIRERNPRNRQMISLAETELLKASADVSRTMKGLEEQMNIFEKKKLEDLKSILQDYVLIELSFHAKAIELFTKAFQDLQNISVEDDVEEFKDALRVPDSISRLDTVKRTSFRSSTPLGSLANLFTTPPRFRRSSDSGLMRSPSKDANAKSQSVDSLKKSIGESSESVEVEDFVDNESLYSSDDYDKK